MSSTVVYQEMSNNFVETGQKIKGSQIVSVKTFSAAEPTTVPDFIGQLAICHDPVAGKPLIYMGTLSGGGTSKGWDLLNVGGGGGGLPDYVVREDSENNFEVFSQTIQQAQIACVTYGTQSAILEPIKGEGHFYIRIADVNKPEFYLSIMNGTNLEWRNIYTKSDIDPNRVPFKDEANDFSNLEQSIGGHPIATVWSGAQSPVDAGIKPKKAGTVFMQISESSPDGKAHVWISRVGASATEFVWEYLDTSGGSASLPATVVRTDKTNNFQNIDQKISGSQILSFVDGGSRSPEESHLPAAYDGQFYIATRTLSTGEKDVNLWIAEGGQWVPIMGGLNKIFARLHESNVFENPMQFLGNPAEVRMISGTRVKRGTKNPVEDLNWKAKIEGEQTIFINTGVNPNAVSLWTAVKVNPGTTNSNEWVKTWDSSHAEPVGDIAYTDQVNIFCPGQMMGEDTTLAPISVARHGVADPLSLKLPPMVSGEIYIETGAGNSGSERHVWVGAEQADVSSWIKIHGNEVPLPDHIAFTDQVNLFVPGQKIGNGTESVELAGARVGESPPGGQLIPFSVGEFYVQKIRDSVDYTVYIATEANNSASWKKVYNSSDSTEGLTQRISELEQAQVGDDARFAEIETEQSDMNKAFDAIEEHMNVLTQDFDVEKEKVNILDTRVGALEKKVPVIDDIISTVQDDLVPAVDDMAVKIQQLLDRVSELEKERESLQEQIKVVKGTAEWSYNNLSRTREASHSPSGPGVHEAVEYAGEPFIQHLAGGKRQVWFGVKPDSALSGSDWIKMDHSDE